MQQPPRTSSVLTSPARRRAFTLVEMTLAAGVVSIVMAGLMGAMTLAGRAAVDSAGRGAATMHRLIDRLREDAAAATAVPQLTATSLTLSVPDRDGDGLAETIVWDWSGATTTGVITRTYNNAPESIAANPKTFAVTAQIDSTPTNATAESVETLLYSRAPASPGAYSIKDKQWPAQVIVPTLPSAATSWRITRVRVQARYKGATGGLARVEVRYQSNGVPLTILDEQQLTEASLPAAFAAQEFTFASAGGLPTGGACVVFEWTKDADAAEIGYETLGSALPGGATWLASTDGGKTWPATSLRAIAMDVYGTYSTPTNATVRKLRQLDIQFKPDVTLGSPVDTAIRFQNQPQVTG